MRLSEFILLNEHEKKSTVFHQGVCLAKSNSFDSVVFLFQLGSYYVEAYCNPENKAIEEYIFPVQPCQSPVEPPQGLPLKSPYRKGNHSRHSDYCHNNLERKVLF